MQPIIDLHQDLMLYVSRPDLYHDRGQTSFEKIKANGVKIAIVSAFPVPPDENHHDPAVNGLIEGEFEKYLDYVRRHPECIIIKNVEDVDRVMTTDGLFGLILHIEGLNVFDEKHGWQTLDRWHDIGLRSIGPMWNINNPFGGGTLEAERGLTELGRQLIGWCETRGVIFDCAHMNEKTFWDAAKVVSRPILVSHGNAQAICPSPRNYSDAQLSKIRETGGAIGVFLSKKFLSGKEDATRDTVLRHINHIVKIAGKDSIAIGSDFGGILSGFAEGLTSLDDLPPFIETLDPDIQEKISSRNALRVIRRHLK